MDYFTNHLPKGEKIIAKTKKSAFIFARDFAILLVMAAIIIGIHLGLKIETRIMMWAYIAAGVIFLFFFMQSLVKFASTMLIVTTHKFMFKEDIITIKVFDTQLANIDSVEVEYRTPLRRMLNVGDIVIRTRNSSHEFRNLARPDTFSGILNKQTALVQDTRIKGINVSFGIPSVGYPPVAQKVVEEKPRARGVKIKGKPKKKLAE